jgi:hypothetical protein
VQIVVDLYIVISWLKTKQKILVRIKKIPKVKKDFDFLLPMMQLVRCQLLGLLPTLIGPTKSLLNHI